MQEPRMKGQEIEPQDVTDETSTSTANKAAKVNDELEFIQNAKKRAEGNPFKFINIILRTDIPEDVIVFPGQPEFRANKNGR